MRLKTKPESRSSIYRAMFCGICCQILSQVRCATVLVLATLVASQRERPDREKPPGCVRLRQVAGNQDVNVNLASINECPLVI